MNNEKTIIIFSLYAILLSTSRSPPLSIITLATFSWNHGYKRMIKIMAMPNAIFVERFSFETKILVFDVFDMFILPQSK